jgi:hypothetical protein
VLFLGFRHGENFFENGATGEVIERAWLSLVAELGT